MNSISVPSRFACLKIEDDEKPSVSATNDNKKTDKNAKKVVKKPTTPNTTSSRQNSSNGKKKSNKNTDKQWEDWKKKDSEMVNDNFEQDMQDAILQSKLEYEANKNMNGLTKIASKKVNSIVNKKKKTKTMSLDQFLEGPEKQPLTDEEKEKNKEDFFDKMMEVARKEVTKGRVEEERKEREVNIEKVITMSQIQEKLKKERVKSSELQKKLDEIKAEVVAVKARNKTLCSILGQGEMREKAEILLELERLNVVKDELTEEVSKLYKLLEQERSKNASVDSKKDKKRKKIA